MQSLYSIFIENKLTISFVISLVMTLISFKLILPLFHNLKFLDKPTARSNHNKPIALGGGLIVIPYIVIIPFLIGYEWSEVFILALLILFSISIIDDLKNVKILLRLLVQFLSIALYVHYYLIEQLTYMYEINKISILLIYLFSTFGIAWFINAFNFMDGIDGISSVQVIYLTAAMIALNYFFKQNNSVLYFSIAGITVGFLLFNWSPASVFLGDSGSIPLGFLMIHLLIDMALKGFWVAALILPLYYILDTSITLAVRAYKKERFWEAHSKHFYQLAVRNGKTHKQVCYDIIIISAGLFIFSIFSVIKKNDPIFLLLSICWCTFFLFKFSDKKATRKKC